MKRPIDDADLDKVAGADGEQDIEEREPEALLRQRVMAPRPGRGGGGGGLSDPPITQNPEDGFKKMKP